MNSPLPTVEIVAPIVVSLVFAAWLGLTLLNQCDRSRRVIAPLLRYDVCSVVPIWTFFAPNPGRTDTHIVYRDIYDDGALSNWRELDLKSRPGLLGLSRGERRVSKGIVDLQHQLLDRQFISPEEVATTNVDGTVPFRRASPAIILSTPYLAILNLATGASHDPFAIGTQFAVAVSEGQERGESATVLFISARHTLAPQLSSSRRRWT
jgi:hypothetical protein